MIPIRLITEREEQAYRLCSPDFHGLSGENAATLMHCHINTIYRLLRRVARKCPQLFYAGFIRPKTPKGYRNYGVRGADFLRYESWMDSEIAMKF